MTGADAEAFARRWIAVWNARDLDTILGFFAEDVRFTSPHATLRIGAPVVTGKPALRGYWAIALAQLGPFEFVLDRVVWDDARHELAIVYTSIRDGVRHRAVELLRFGAGGLVVEGEALYGVTLPDAGPALA